MSDSSVNPPSSKPPSTDSTKPPKDSAPKGGGEPMFGDGTFMGMPVTKEQMKQIMNNMCKMILSDIKRDQKRMQAAMDKIKKAAEGGPM